MRKYFVIAALALVCASCAEINRPSANDIYGDGIVIKAVKATIPQTKTTYSFDSVTNSYKTFWASGDEILVSDETTSSAVFSTSVAEACAISDFAGTFATAGEELFAIYPADAATAYASKFVVDIPAEQTWNEYSFADWSSSDIKFGHCDEVSDDEPEFVFQNLMAMVKFNLQLESGFQFFTGETVETIEIAAPEGVALAGTFEVSKSAAPQLSCSEGSNTITIDAASAHVDNTGSYSILAALAPCTIDGNLTVTLYTTGRTIIRTIALEDFDFESNNWYDLNLTSIGGSAYTQVSWYEAPEVSVITVNSLSANVRFTDVVTDGADRLYTAQLRVKNGANVIDCVNFKVENSTLYGVNGASVALPAGLTFDGLAANTTYECRFKAAVPGKTADWSEWAEFTTGAASATFATQAEMFMDFNEIKGYGTGDYIYMAASTYPGATVVSDHLTSVSGYQAWCQSLDQLGASPASIASYRVGDMGPCSAVGSSNAANTAINGVQSQSNVFGRSGYIQLGTSSSVGTMVVDINPNGFQDKKLGYQVTFKACVLGSDSNATVDLAMLCNCKFPIGTQNSNASASVTVAASGSNGVRNHQWVECSTSIYVSRNLGITGTPTWQTGTITFTSNGAVAVLIDDLRITKLLLDDE